MKKTPPQQPTEGFLNLDEQGIFFLDSERVKSEEVGQHLLQNLTYAENGSYTTSLEEETYLVEVFDQPFIGRKVLVDKDQLILVANYNCRINLDLSKLRVDEWDRFHGRTKKGLPYVLNAKAQDQLFTLLDEYDDDSVTWKGTQYPVLPLWESSENLNGSEFWSSIYNQEENPRWNLDGPAEALKDMLPRLKLAKSKVLVLGCGEGHDAAHFAKEGHRVTAVDISAEAIEKAKKTYGHLANVEFLQKDLFELDLGKHYDVILEHTCYCAIDPTRRSELVKIWNKHIIPGGFLIGIFFAYDKPAGPPFGASEWEIRQRLQKDYQFVFWGRWQKSLPRRQGREVFVLAEKRRG